MGSETHIMVDLETLGTEPGSVILSIGAVHFCHGEILHSFQATVTPESCVALGLKADPGTMMWWLKQSDAARQALLDGQQGAAAIVAVLDDFKRWLAQRAEGDWGRVKLWSNGASFDGVLLAAAYRMAGLQTPWKYSGERCYRTVKALHPEVEETAREGTHHDALADATHQARHLMKLLPHL